MSNLISDTLQSLIDEDSNITTRVSDNIKQYQEEHPEDSIDSNILTHIISTENLESDEGFITEEEAYNKEEIITETIKDEHNKIVESSTNIETEETETNPSEENDISEQVSLSVISSNLVSNLISDTLQSLIDEDSNITTHISDNIKQYQEEHPDDTIDSNILSNLLSTENLDSDEGYITEEGTYHKE